VKVVEVLGGPTKCRVCGRRCNSQGHKHPVRIFKVLLRAAREGTHDSIKGYYTFNLCLAHLSELGLLIGEIEGRSPERGE